MYRWIPYYLPARLTVATGRRASAILTFFQSGAKHIARFLPGGFSNHCRLLFGVASVTGAATVVRGKSMVLCMYDRGGLTDQCAPSVTNLHAARCQKSILPGTSGFKSARWTLVTLFARFIRTRRAKKRLRIGTPSIFGDHGWGFAAHRPSIWVASVPAGCCQKKNPNKRHTSSPRRCFSHSSINRFISSGLLVMT